MKKFIILSIAIIGLSSCKDSTRAQFSAMNKPHIVTLYGATGTVISRWESTGSISNEDNSDGWYFEDAATGKLVEITGTIVITVK